MDVLQTLNIELNFTGALKNFLDSMRNKGTCDLAFMPTPEFKEGFQLKENSYKFNTHKELDDFVKKICETDSYNFKMNPKFLGDYFLLKSFDRGFWYFFF
jgi:hypothetical protein